MFNIQQAAVKAGISSGLLHLWVSVGKIKPSVDMTVDFTGIQDAAGRKAAQQWAHRDETTNWVFTETDIARLRKLVEQTAEKKATTAKAGNTHIKGTDWKPQELAIEWGLGVDKIRELFANEPDVKKIQKPKKRGRRAYVTLRIPERVAERVQRRLGNA